MIVARKVPEFLKESGDRFQKTIVFCVDTVHAARMRQALINENPDLVQQNADRDLLCKVASPPPQIPHANRPARHRQHCIEALLRAQP